MAEPRTGTTKVSKKSASQKTKEKVDTSSEKAPKRSLYVRRAIENHFEERRLSALSDDDWWDNI